MVLQFTGEGINTWGLIENAGFVALTDFSIAGLTTKALTADYILTTALGAADEARAAILKFTGAGPFTVTIPSVSKTYDVWNLCSGVVTLTTGAGTTVAVQPSEVCRVICDGSNVKRSQGTEFAGQRLTSLADPLNPQDAATKAYADALAFTANAGILPGQGPGTIGWFLESNGTNALWKQIQSTDIGDFVDAVIGLALAAQI